MSREPISRDPKVVFLARRAYRRRRMADAARMLPLIGVFLLSLPLLWASDGDAPTTTFLMIYLFGTWLLLAIVSGLISAQLRHFDETDTEDREGS